jgi:catechol 2,3-dioxygenase-like lactoylglutathione lyase family enzyme
MRLRQVALVARDLEVVVADLCAVLGIEVAYRDPGIGVFGLRNAVMPLGDTFLEVVSPIQANTPAGRYLARRGGDGGYMVLFQCGDIDAQRQRIDRLGVRVAWSIDLPQARSLHLHPRDVGGAIVSFEQMTRPEDWYWAGPRWRDCVHSDVVTGISGVELQADDPRALAERWSAVLGEPLIHDASGQPAIHLASGSVRFIATAGAQGDGVSGLDLAIASRGRLVETARARGLPADDDHVVIAGTRISFA